MNLKLLTINTHGLNHPAKRLFLWKEAIASKACIIIVQETLFQASALPKCHHKGLPHILVTYSSKKLDIYSILPLKSQ